MEVRDSAGSIVFSSTDNQDTVTLSSEGSYTASCKVNGEATAIPACQQTLRVTT